MATSSTVLHHHILVLLVFVALTATDNHRIVVLANQCTAQTNSIYGQRLRKHVIRETFESGMFQCVMRCEESLDCQSMNYRMMDQLCQLNDASHTSHNEDFGPEHGYIYMENPNKPKQVGSCLDVKVLQPSNPSGYYVVKLKDRRIKVYCDMDNYGGGWTLVVSISNQNINHLLTTQHNCYNSSLCVPYEGNVVTATRKLHDNDVRQLAKGEGTFRIRMLDSSPVDVFYRIPSGQDKFNSSCAGIGCPRITVSYSPHPYAWESNPCMNNSIGYRIANDNAYRVFDGHDDGECGSIWTSSLYSSGKRVLYGYQGHTGLYGNKNGMLFVR